MKVSIADQWKRKSRGKKIKKFKAFMITHKQLMMFMKIWKTKIQQGNGNC